jgi:UDP-glucose:glycoprotein glucosyltransferase
MRAFRPSLSAKRLLLLSATGFIGALAGPNINVALRAAFDSAPYLVELLYVLDYL